MYKMLAIFLAFSVVSVKCQTESKEHPDFILNYAHARHARARCQQQYPLADTDNFGDTEQTHCYLQCFLYRMGLMDLTTRGLDGKKFLDIWEGIDEAFLEDNCMERFFFNEPLNGGCSDCYRKLMEFRTNCLELFDFTFSNNSTWKPEESKYSKKIGQSATEYCDSLEGENVDAQETSQDNDATLITQYVEKMKCIYENFHYLDAYGRVDEYEINLSYQEAKEDSEQTRSIISICSHRANTNYQQNRYGDLVLELKKCLKTESPIYSKVYKLRDETSRQY